MSAAMLAVDWSKSKRGNGVDLWREVDDGVVDLDLPRTIGGYHSPQHVMRNLLMLSPLLNGLRIMVIGEVRRRRSQAHGAAMIWDAIELAEGTSGTSSSPGAARA
jgi:hypothetical protein